MNKKHRKTLEAVFQQPVPASLVVEGAGSRVRFELNGVIGTFHRPHPQKEAKPYQVRDARSFLEKAEVLP